MFDATDQILRQLRAGEDIRTEFKELRYGKRGVISPRTENLAAEMVAFANAEGGTCIFGVDDSGAPAGVSRDRLDAVEQSIINVASDLCDPPIRPLLRRAVVPGADGEVTVVMADLYLGTGDAVEQMAALAAARESVGGAGAGGVGDGGPSGGPMPSDNPQDPDGTRPEMVDEL
ncbi:MAG: ATP-binding protein [Gemmatimonadota bacterium]|nr:ATP-binding protein [Gemmatimonadota bacterium]